METVGILGLGVYLPEGRMSAKEARDGCTRIFESH